MFARQFLILHPWHLDMNIDADEQRAGEALLIAGDGGRRAGTLAHRIGGVAAGAPMQIAITLSVADVYY